MHVKANESAPLGRQWPKTTERRHPVTRSIPRVLALTIVLLLGVTLFGAVAADHTPAPTSVTIAGDLQSELGCGVDWDPTCAATDLTYDAIDDVWQAAFNVPAGNWNYKAALNHSWDENYGLNAAFNGANIPLSLGAATNVKFYYSHETHWITSNQNSRIVTAAGSFQNALGCGGDWQPDCLRSWLQDPDGDGTYTFVTEAIPAGGYEVKAAINEGWDESYGAGGGSDNIQFNVPNACSTTTFSFVSATNILTVNSVAGQCGGGSASHDNDIWWSHLGHDSRDTLYRSPGKAVPTGTDVRLRLRAADGDLTAAQVRVWDDRLNVQHIYNMTKVASGVTLPDDPELYEFWEYTLPASALPTVYWYRFIAIDGSATAYYEDDDGRMGGWGQVFSETGDRSWQLTIYDPAFTTPDWIKNAVVYQIFPDRFRDGDNSNNPTAGEFFYGAFDTIVRSNSADWNARICDPRSNAGSTAVCADKYSQNFYGGDLQGIIDKLDYLETLGVTALYLNPIFESPSNHKYDTKDFMVIDDNFGDLALFQQLVAAADARGIRLILDGVFNHSSSDSTYFDRYSRWDAEGDPTTLGANDGSGACESTASPFVDWYTFFNYTGGGTSPCSDNRDYPKWFGIFDSLPVFQHDYPAVRDYFIGEGGGATDAVGPYWIGQGAAGWRLDVAPEVDHGTINDPTDDYWEMFREAVKSVDPDAYIVGEEWGNSTSWTIDNQWDASMNYRFGAALMSFLRDTPFSDNDFNSGSSAGELNPIDTAGLAERLLYLEEIYAPEAFAAMMNLFNSHDTNRVLFLLNHDADQNNVALYNDPNYDWSDSIERYKAALILQMTLPGAPTIYYGDEVGTVNPPSRDGTWWQDDPYNRVPYPWLDQSGTPYYAHMQSQTSQDALYDYVAGLAGIRNSFEALRTGSLDLFGTFNPTNPNDAGVTNSVFAFGRKSADGSQIAVVFVNKTGSELDAGVNLGGYVPSGAGMMDMLSGDTYTLNGSDQLIAPIPGLGGRIFILDGVPQPPAAVGDLTASASSSSSIDLDWGDATGAAEYDIYRSLISGGGYEFIGTTTDSDYSDTGLTAGQTYYYVVVSRSADGLTSGWSNEASATPFYTINWANLQWPPSLTHAISATELTDTIYGQVFIDGVTSQPGATPGLTAEVGYGDTNDVDDGSWEWFDMTFNADAGNNDEFMGNLPRVELGTFCYTTRYSGDGGDSWFYAVNGPNEANATCPGPFGVLTITLGADTTAPAAPANLVVTGTTSASISLGWDAHPNTDGDLYGFRVYRGPAGGPYTEIALVAGADATSYIDTTVTTGTTYEYTITAVDDSLNESDNSNLVTATAEDRITDVTFRVTVPEGTPGTVYLAGNFGPDYPEWDPGAAALAMTLVSPNTWELTLQILDGTTVEYKYTRGSWETVEKGADGNLELNNRSQMVDYGANGEQLITDNVLNWRDPFVTGHSPADGATDVDPSAVVTITWNQEMPATLGGTFTVTGPGGVVTGTVSYDDVTDTHTFTPDGPMAGGSYTVLVSGNTDVNGDVQQVATTFDFEVVEPVEACTPEDGSFRPSQTSLWPVNGKMRMVVLQSGGPPRQLEILGVWQDEPVGSEPDAARGNNSHQVRLRAERDNNGDGRVYTIVFEFTRRNGETCQGAVTVDVPLTRGAPAVNGGMLYDSFGD